LRHSRKGEKSLVMKETAKGVALATVIVIAIGAGALALWELRLVIALVFLGFILAAAMRPGIEALRRHGLPRALGLALHYVVLFALVGPLDRRAARRRPGAERRRLDGGDTPAGDGVQRHQARGTDRDRPAPARFSRTI
jgi:hypothetical protein